MSPIKARNYLETLRAKWITIPFTADGRAHTTDLTGLDDAGLLQQWEKAREATVEGERLNYMRGWFQLVYKDWCRGKKIIDIGCGLGIDGIYFAEHGAKVTFIDIAESNVELVRRICRLKGIEQACSFLVMTDIDDLAKLDRDYDAVMGVGSLMHAPINVMKPEFDLLVACLKDEGGRFIMNAYPKARWVREGCLPFDQWGVKTDGEGTPWAEWYDADKLIESLKPARFELVYYCEYRKGDMNCIDVVRRSSRQLVLPADSVLFAQGDLLEAVTFWEGASLKHEQSSLQVTTGPVCWSYAAQIPVSASAGENSSGKRFRLLVKASVQQGEIGIAIPSKDGQRFLVELRFDRNTDPEQLSAEVDDEIANIAIVRNACRDHQPSRACIEYVRLYSY